MADNKSAKARHHYSAGTIIWEIVKYVSVLLWSRPYTGVN